MKVLNDGGTTSEDSKISPQESMLPSYFRLTRVFALLFFAGILVSAAVNFGVSGQSLNDGTLARTFGMAVGLALFPAFVTVPWRLLQKVKSDAPIKLGFVIFAVLAAGQFMSARFEVTAPQNQYLRVNLGATKDEVAYLLGRPNSVERVPTDEDLHNFLDSDMKASEFFRDLIKDARGMSVSELKKFPLWHYGGDGSSIFQAVIRFGAPSDAVIRITCMATAYDGRPRERRACPPLFDLEIGDEEGVLRQRLGFPSYEALEEGIKYVEYRERNAVFKLERSAIIMIGIQKPDFTH
jgi:hypothetical protein